MTNLSGPIKNRSKEMETAATKIDEHHHHPPIKRPTTDWSDGITRRRRRSRLNILRQPLSSSLF
ncbi:hypothetical protein HanHA300_Chr09g0300431 [Helianthus annuus]|nr:hypothetical protein HanHA300_Chr09g0300431 [Helianthus annuus]KAJ0540639.1 hypothetical protein HanHA89_Chr09g0319071 [Helianthus annuus]KAJ0705789.1 hypothetical protein HanLR1_Chr09g0299351 [Helianthus annuus]KAJ0709927.1 hypothetical protein HanOQP8_Chr09g0306191 [Helianthus annuus]